MISAADLIGIRIVRIPVVQPDVDIGADLDGESTVRLLESIRPLMVTGNSGLSWLVCEDRCAESLSIVALNRVRLFWRLRVSENRAVSIKLSELDTGASIIRVEAP